MLGDFPPNQTKTVVLPPPPPPYFLGLPKDPWFLIYEHYLTDPDGENKGNFSLACKTFANISKDNDFIKYLCHKYLPVLIDSPDYVKNPQKLLPILRKYFAPLPAIDNIEKFIARFLSLHFVLGYSFGAITSRFVPELQRMYRRLNNRDQLLATLNQRLSGEDVRDDSFYTAYAICQRDPARLQNVPQLRFDMAVTSSVAANNFRMLAFLLDADNFNSPEGMNGIRFAATFGDIPLLKQLMAQKETTLDFSKDPTLIAIKALLEAEVEEEESDDESEEDNFHQIQSRLNIKRFDNNVKQDLNADSFLSRISRWNFDDIFRTMSAETLHRLQRLAGQGALNAALLRPLCKAGRVDLIALLDLPEVEYVSQIVGPFIESFEKQRLAGVESPHLVMGPCKAMLDNRKIRDVLLSYQQFLSWAFENKIEDLILLGLQSVNVGEPGIEETIKNLITWALDNQKGQMLDTLFRRFGLNTAVLKALLNEAMVRNLAELALNVLRAFRRIGFGNEYLKRVGDNMIYVDTYLALLRWAIQHNHQEIIRFMLEDDFTNNTRFRAKIAEVMFEAIQNGNKTLEPLFYQFIANKGYICNNEMLPKVVEKMSPDYLEKFRVHFLQNCSSPQLITFLSAIEKRGNSQFCFTTGLIALGQEEWERSSLLFLINFLSMHKARAGIRERCSLSFEHLSTLLNLDKLNHRMLMADDKANVNPYAEIYLMLDTCEDYLTASLKIKLLNKAHIYHATVFQNYLLSKYPNDLTYENFCQHLGVNHPLAEAHRPSLASRALQLVSSYIPGFTNSKKRDIEQTKEVDPKKAREGDKDDQADPEEARKKRNRAASPNDGML